MSHSGNANSNTLVSDQLTYPAGNPEPYSSSINSLTSDPFTHVLSPQFNSSSCIDLGVSNYNTLLNRLSDKVPLFHSTFCSSTSTICGKATSPNQSTCSFPLLLHPGCWAMLEKITWLCGLKPWKIHGLYHQLPGDPLMSPRQLTYSPHNSLPNQLCPQGLYSFTLRVWSHSCFTKKNEATMQ